jgi:hypothetical protein
VKHVDGDIVSPDRRYPLVLIAKSRVDKNRVSAAEDD